MLSYSSSIKERRKGEAGNYIPSHIILSSFPPFRKLGSSIKVKEMHLILGQKDILRIAISNSVFRKERVFNKITIHTFCLHMEYRELKKSFTLILKIINSQTCIFTTFYNLNRELRSQGNWLTKTNPIKEDKRLWTELGYEHLLFWGRCSWTFSEEFSWNYQRIDW